MSVRTSLPAARSLLFIVIAGRDDTTPATSVDAAPRAKAAAARAMELDPDLGEAHTVDAFARYVFDFDFAAAEAGFRRALELAPGNADTHDLYGRLLSGQRRFDEAVHVLERAFELDPFTHRADFANVLMRAGREEEHTGYKHNDLRGQMEKADRKALGRFLHDLAGNPYRPFRFEPDWRTSTVTALARAITVDRAFDRLPILADALLDADCDEEAILRHCRGTEAHAPDGPAHGRGCWVLDLILQAEPVYFTADPIRAEPPPPPLAPRTGPARATPGWAALLDAMRSGNLSDPDDQDE